MSGRGPEALAVLVALAPGDCRAEALDRIAGGAAREALDAAVGALTKRAGASRAKALLDACARIMMGEMR